MQTKQIGAIWVTLVVALLWIVQLWLGQETVAAAVATVLGAAAVVRDAWQIVNSPEQAGTRSAGPQRSKVRRWLLGD